MAYARTYPLVSLLNLMEQFCHLLPNELDHCGVVIFIYLNAANRVVQAHPCTHQSCTILLSFSDLDSILDPRFVLDVETSAHYIKDSWKLAKEGAF